MWGGDFLIEDFAEMTENIKEGDWLLEYMLGRLTSYDEQDMHLEKLAEFFGKCVELIKQLPKDLKLKYTIKFFKKLYDELVFEILTMRCQDDFICAAQDPFMQKMALAVYQFHARVPSAYFLEHKDSMCAGLCHFSTGFCRCWGRDTFIALRGLYVATGLENEARNTILYFAKVMRHGLIPNLHDGGNNTRFNARDAAWFFLQAIKDYCLISEDGDNFLSTKV